MKGKGKGCSGGRVAQEKSKGTKSWQKERKAHVFKSCDKATLRYEDDVPLNARRGAPVDESPHTTFPQHVLEPGWRSWTDTDTDSSTSTDSDLSLYIIWGRVEPQSWCCHADTGSAVAVKTTHSVHKVITEVCNIHE